MSEEQAIRYDKMMEEALRGIVKRVLKDAQQDGLPDPHHFYVSFNTNFPKVDMPDFLREKYPHEMTIVLQHQFWDLKVTEEHFEVTLSFSKVPCNLYIPFDAITGFADPAVEFGLQFHAAPVTETIAKGETESLQEADNADEDNKADTKKKKSKAIKSKKKNASEKEKDEKVVSLDAFRKN